MQLPEEGWLKVAMPEASREVMESFNNLVADQYATNSHRYRRFSQYRVFFENGAWRLEKLPHRPLIQPRAYNSAAGGVMREFAPMECDPSASIDAVLKAGKLDVSQVWHLDINQYRVYAQQDKEGICVPEGAHRDGHQYVKVMVFKRHAIRGAEMSLLQEKGGVPFHRSIVQAGEAIIIDDTKMFHDATNIVAAGPETGHRDYFGTSMNLWENRKYGPEFEKRMMSLG